MSNSNGYTHSWIFNKLIKELIKSKLRSHSPASYLGKLRLVQGSKTKPNMVSVFRYPNRDRVSSAFSNISVQHKIRITTLRLTQLSRMASRSPEVDAPAVEVKQEVKQEEVAGTENNATANTSAPTPSGAVEGLSKREYEIMSNVIHRISNFRDK